MFVSCGNYNYIEQTFSEAKYTETPTLLNNIEGHFKEK
jgi:hypothetical protein